MKRFVLLFVVLFASHLGAQESGEYVPGGTVTAIDSIQRKYDATTYAANDAVQDSTAKWLKFNVAKAPGGGGYITGLYAEADTANVSNATFEVLFFRDTTGVTLIADNAALTMLSGNMGKRLGPPVQIALTTGGTGSTMAAGGSLNINQAFTCLQGSTFVYALIRATAAYVPKKRGTINLRIWVERN